MTTTRSFRSAVFAAIDAWKSANYPSLPVVYENGPVPDQQSIGPIWLDVELRFYGGSSAAVGVPAQIRDTGALSLQVYRREGEGTDQSDDILDSLALQFSNKNIGGGFLGARQRTVPSPRLLGWYRTGLLIPFRIG